MRLSLQKSIGEVREAVDATIQREVAEALNSRGMAQVETRFHEIKNWMKNEIGGLTQNLQHVHKAQSRVETLLGSHVKDFTNFRDETHKRVWHLTRGLCCA